MNPQHLNEVTQDIETWRLNPTPDNDPYRVYHKPDQKIFYGQRKQKWLEIVRRDSFLWKKKP